MSEEEWADACDIHHGKILSSSYSKLASVGF